MDPVIDYLRKQLIQKKEDLSNVVSSGSSTDYPEYKYQVGIQPRLCDMDVGDSRVEKI